MMRLLSTIPRIQGKYKLPTDPDKCVLWTAYRNPAGYGQVRVNMVGWLATRYVFTELFGPIPEGLVVMHICDNPACIHPGHLTIGTHGDNIRDKEAKGRGNQGSQNGQSKLSDAEVLAIRASYTGQRGELAALGRQYNVNRSCIYKIVNNHHWTKL